MAVAQDRTVANVGLFTPFRGFDREFGAVGTLYCDAEATGDGSGGTVRINLLMSRLEFGFHPIWVVTNITTTDLLTSAAAVRMAYTSDGNERLSSSLDEAQVAIAAPGNTNIAAFTNLSVPIEPDIAAGLRVLSALWATNETGDVYHMHVFGPVYDGEALARGKARGKGADNLLSGIR